MNIGLFGFNLNNVREYGAQSIEIGQKALANGPSSLAVGTNCTASNRYSVSIGYGNQDVPFPANSTGSANYGVANSTPLGSVLVGYWNFVTATSKAAVAIGILNNQTALYDIRYGFYNNTGLLPIKATTVGTASVAMGYNNQAQGDLSVAIGNGCKAVGGSSFAAGVGATANGAIGTSIGYLANQSGFYNLAIGYVATVSGQYASAVGADSNAGGLRSQAIGANNTSAGNYSSAIGTFNSSPGVNSTAIGRSNSMDAASLNCHLVGGYNFASSTSFASVAFGLLNNQTGGTLNTTTGAITGSPAVGTVGRLSVAVGVSNTASGNFSLALGINASTNSNANSIVIACDQSNTTQSTAANQLVIGPITTAYLGNGVTNATPNNISLNATGGSGSNTAGGSLTVASGISTGNAVPSLLRMQSTALGGASGTTAQTLVDRKVLGASKVLTNNTVTALTNATLASGTVIAGTVRYAVEVTDGTDYQVEQGTVSFITTNKAGSIANNTTVKFGNQQAMTAGTLTVTWTITAANPAVISLNANSSLTPSTGFPRVTYEIVNLTQQAIAIQ